MSCNRSRLVLSLNHLHSSQHRSDPPGKGSPLPSVHSFPLHIKHPVPYTYPPPSSTVFPQKPSPLPMEKKKIYGVVMCRYRYHVRWPGHMIFWYFLLGFWHFSVIICHFRPGIWHFPALFCHFPVIICHFNQKTPAYSIIWNMQVFGFSSPGDVLRSRGVAARLPSALKSLTSVFGMGTGGASSLSPPDRGRHSPKTE